MKDSILKCFPCACACVRVRVCACACVRVRACACARVRASNIPNFLNKPLKSIYFKKKFGSVAYSRPSRNAVLKRFLCLVSGF